MGRVGLLGSLHVGSMATPEVSPKECERLVQQCSNAALGCLAVASCRGRKFVPISSTVHRRSLRSEIFPGPDTPRRPRRRRPDLNASSDLDLDDGLSGSRNELPASTTNERGHLFEKSSGLIVDRHGQPVLRWQQRLDGRPTRPRSWSAFGTCWGRGGSFWLPGFCSKSGPFSFSVTKSRQAKTHKIKRLWTCQAGAVRAQLGETKMLLRIRLSRPHQPAHRRLGQPSGYSRIAESTRLSTSPWKSARTESDTAPTSPQAAAAAATMIPGNHQVTRSSRRRSCGQRESCERCPSRSWTT